MMKNEILSQANQQQQQQWQQQQQYQQQQRGRAQEAELHRTRPPQVRAAARSWQWHEGLFDSRIWTANRMAESSSPWGAPLEGGSFIVYEGAVQLWCQAQMGSWGNLSKGHTFGQRGDES